MKHRSPGLIFSLTVALTCTACGPPPDETGTHRGPLAWGKPDPAHHEVGSLGGCSSTLIGRKTVLTAAHCVRSLTRKYKFTTRGKATSSTRVKVHPNYDGNVSDDADIAIIHLEKNVPGVRPATLVDSALKAGEPLVMVGFGLTDQGLSGKKYVGDNRIDTLLDKTFTIINEKGAATCPGDSGGPSFAVRGGKEYLAGVHSRGTYPPCGTLFGSGIDVRVDVFLDWIKLEAGADLYKGEPIDTTAPVVAITSPAAGASTTRTFTVEATATDNVAVTSVELWLNGTKQETLTGSSPFSFKLQGLYPTNHTIKVVAHDAETNRGEAQVGITVKPGAPFGEACKVDTDCHRERCAADAAGLRFCSKACVADSACPAGYLCSLEGLCALPAEDGCSVGRPSAPLPVLASLLLVTLLCLRRRGVR